jgi:hypothetical protein
MFQILTDGTSFRITREEGVERGLYVADLAELLRLRQRINDYIDTQEADSELSTVTPPPAEILKTGDALRLAKEAGYDLPRSTLVSACAQGLIAGAYKEGARWRIPYADFDGWFQVWSTKQD